MKTAILCACVDAENRPDRDCTLGCGGSGELCSRCLDKPGRWMDGPCPDCDSGRTFYEAPDERPSDEAIRFHNLMVMYLA